MPRGCSAPVPISAAVACAEATSESDNVATQYGPLAQLVARLVRIEEVRSSNLLGSTDCRELPAQRRQRRGLRGVFH